MKNLISIFTLMGVVYGATANTCLAGPCEDLLEMRERVYSLKKEKRESGNPERRS